MKKTCFQSGAYYGSESYIEPAKEHFIAIMKNEQQKQWKLGFPNTHTEAYILGEKKKKDEKEDYGRIRITRKLLKNV